MATDLEYALEYALMSGRAYLSRDTRHVNNRTPGLEEDWGWEQSNPEHYEASGFEAHTGEDRIEEESGNDRIELRAGIARDSPGGHPTHPRV